MIVIFALIQRYALLTYNGRKLARNSVGREAILRANL